MLAEDQRVNGNGVSKLSRISGRTEPPVGQQSRLGMRRRVAAELADNPRWMATRRRWPLVSSWRSRPRLALGPDFPRPISSHS